jgi:hypothetical protein
MLAKKEEKRKEKEKEKNTPPSVFKRQKNPGEEFRGEQ